MTLNVLLVDDDPIVREVLGAQLRKLGCEVSAASGRVDALAAAAQVRFDRLLLDQRLGDVDGRRLLAELRGCAGAADAAALAITAELDDDLRRRLLHAGFADALLKPITITQLAAALGLDADGAALASALTSTPSLDDRAAVAIWGSMDTVTQLRRILLDELDVYRQVLADCAARHDAEALREVLHRMKSSAGFCGALPLLKFIEACRTDPVDWASLLHRYDAACAVLRPDLRAVLAT